MVITHYYVKGEAPFRRIAELPPGQQLAVCSGLQCLDLPVFARFKWQDYMTERAKTETWLREEFLKAGGKPEIEHPFYFVLGSPEYLLKRYQGMGAKIEISLGEIADEHIGFTFPDSMASRLISESRDPSGYKPSLHGRIFLKPEVEILLQLTLPSGQDKDYIEAQLWSSRYLTKYL